MKYALKLKLLFFFIPLISLAQESPLKPADFPGCPDGTFKTDVPIPSRQQRLIFCYKLVDQERLNHGDYWRFDLQDNLIEKLFYQNGELEKKPSKSPVLPTAENDKNSPDLSFMRSVAHELIMRFLPIIRQDRGPLAVGGFETRECLTDRSGLLSYYRGERPNFRLNYRFHRGRCSLQGRHEFELRKIHRVNFEVNDLSLYQKVEFQLLIKPTVIDEEKTQIELVISQGHLQNDFGGLDFEASYQVVLNDQGRAVGAHQGEVKVTGFQSQKTQQNFKLSAPIRPAP